MSALLELEMNCIAPAHPNLLRIADVMISEEFAGSRLGLLFPLALETLQARIARNGPRQSDCQSITGQLLRGVAALHGARISRAGSMIRKGPKRKGISVTLQAMRQL